MTILRFVFEIMASLMEYDKNLDTNYTICRSVVNILVAVADPEVVWGYASPGTHNAPKLAILRSEMEKKFLGRGTTPSPDPSPWGGGYSLHTPHTLAARLQPHPPLMISGSATVRLLFFISKCL